MRVIVKRFRKSYHVVWDVNILPEILKPYIRVEFALNDQIPFALNASEADDFMQSLSSFYIFSVVT